MFVKLDPNKPTEPQLRSWFEFYYPQFAHYPLGFEKQEDPYKERLWMIYKKKEHNICHILGYKLFETGEFFEPHPPIITWEPKEQQNNTEIPMIIPCYEKMDGNVTIDKLTMYVDVVLGKQTGTISFDDFAWFVLLFYGQLIPQWHTIYVNYLREHFPKKQEIETNHIEPTIQDKVEYFNLYPMEYSCPSVWYEVKLEELPESLMHKPIYKGGYFHLHEKELYLWVFRKILLNLRYPNQPHPQLNVVLSYILSYLKTSRKKGAGNVNQLPPCLRKWNHFPNDSERVALVKVAKYGEIPIEDIEDMLNHYNTKFPKYNMTLKRRFDVKAHYQQNYKSKPRCEHISWCPMGKLGTTLDKKKMECHQQFQKEFPDYFNISQANYFYGPADWFKWLQSK